MSNGIPNSPDEDIRLAKEDLGYTEEMRALTINIENLIKGESNYILMFYRNFQEMLGWIIANMDNLAIQPQIIQQIDWLRSESVRLMMLLGNIKAMTENEIRLDAKKLMIKVTIEHDLNEERRLEKILKFPSDITSLVKGIIRTVSESRGKVSKDSDTEKKTIEVIDRFNATAAEINSVCDRLVSSMGSREEFQLFMDVMKELVGRISTEIQEFEELDSMEKLHLQLLLSLYASEQEIIEKETKVAERDRILRQSTGTDTERLI